MLWCQKRIKLAATLYSYITSYMVKNAPLYVSRITEKWEHEKSILLKRFPILRIKDFLFPEGEEEEMFKRVQVKTGKSKEQIDAILCR